MAKNEKTGPMPFGARANEGICGREAAQSMRSKPRTIPALLRFLGFGMAALAVAACQPNAREAVTSRVVVTSAEPQATDIGRQVLAGGGTAADAAVSMGLTMAVTLPSRVGLGGGGVCLHHDGRDGSVTTYDFPSNAAASGRAGLPAMVRGLYAMHSEQGSSQWQALVSPAEVLAQTGYAVGEGLAADIASIANVIDRLPDLSTKFSGPNGLPLALGQVFVQPDLATVLTGIRTGGVTGFYTNETGRLYAEATVPAGAPITVEEVRATAPTIAPAVSIETGNDRLWTPAEPLTGGPALSDAFGRLQDLDGPDYGDRDAASRLQALLDVQRTALRTVGAGGDTSPGASLAVVDRFGNGVACTFTLNGLFGSGAVAEGTGIVVAAAPATGVMRSSGPAIVANQPTRTLVYVGTGSGMFAASLIPLAERVLTGLGMSTAMGSSRLATDFSQGGVLVEEGAPTLVQQVAEATGQQVRRAPFLGLGQAVGCDWDRETGITRCTAVADPRGFGVAVTEEEAGMVGGFTGAMN